MAIEPPNAHSMSVPPAMPERLHWFKWEAYTTLLSGLFLLGIVYYANAATLLVEPGVTPFGPTGAIVASIAFLVGGGLVYDATGGAGVRKQLLVDYLEGLRGAKVHPFHPVPAFSKRQQQAFAVDGAGLVARTNGFALFDVDSARLHCIR